MTQSHNRSISSSIKCADHTVWVATATDGLVHIVDADSAPSVKSLSSLNSGFANATPLAIAVDISTTPRTIF